MFNIFNSMNKGKEGTDNNNQNTNSNANQNNNNQNTNQQQTNQMMTGIADPNANNNNNQNTNTPPNPLDAFKSLFDNTNKQEDKAPTFTIPEEGLGKVAQGLDFLKSVDPELITKAQSGNPQAIIDLQQAMARNAYQTAIQHMSALSGQFIDSRLEYNDKSLGSRVKQELTTHELGTNTPGFDHPVVKAQLVSTAEALAKQFPDASPQEIAQKAKDYVIQIANAVNPNKQDNQADTDKASGVTDWGAYLSKGNK